MDRIFEYVRVTTAKVAREVSDLESLNTTMKVLTDIRSKESDMDMEIAPILYMYTLLENQMPEGFITQEEMDMRSVLSVRVRGLVPAPDQLFKLDAPRAERRFFEVVVSRSSPMVGRTIREGGSFFR